MFFHQVLLRVISLPANIQSNHHLFLPGALHQTPLSKQAAKRLVVDAQVNLIQRCHCHQDQMLQTLHLQLVYYIINSKMTIVKQLKNDASYTGMI
ncbi:hypothetical protein CROQUDRAFT_655565 [Cronartium quercuum f. sp. fusiforme G11]|uniref:Uncharacterized protein n=1 Tax=Cronartium quercuum f. sp. fusiforme G11 TaxID=708437 RepID=A0A9P6TDR3_9BASI|nr:hypothetical protein CROQUDRAFT_655565 [Cronartium quercuum f. sp. fusiforme G11]